MLLRHVVVVSVLGGCGQNSAQPDAMVASDSVAVDAIDAAAPPPVCTAQSLNTPRSVGSAIDAAGNIAGAYVAPDGGIHAARWDAPSYGLIDLGTLGGGYSVASGISGEFTVGRSKVSDADDRAFISDASGMRELVGPYGAVGVNAYGVNATGVVVGDAATPDGFYRHAMRYEAGVAIDLGSLPGKDMSTAVAINDSGVIVGAAYGYGAPSGGLGSIPVIWVNGVISPLAAAQGTAVAINAAGNTSVGDFKIYSGGTAATLDMPAKFGGCNAHSASVRGVNDAGWIVGSHTCQDAPESNRVTHASIHIGGSPWDLEGLLTNPTGRSSATAINNAGQIAANQGVAQNSSQQNAVLITCVPTGP